MKAQNQCPDQTENELFLLLVNVLGRNVDEFDLLLPQKVEREIQVLNFLQLHFRFLIHFRLDCLARKNFKQIKEIDAVRQIFVELVDLNVALEQKRVAPSRKRLWKSIKN